MDDRTKSILEAIKNTLLDNIEELGTTVEDIECEVLPIASSDKKENFSSNLFTADLINDKTGTTISVLVKLMPENPRVRRLHNSDKQFFNEILMYRRIIPLFWEIFNPGDKHKHQSLFPKFYCGSYDPEAAMIAVENLMPQGYGLAVTGQTLDFEHCRLAMEGLARFHAPSYYMKSKDRSLFMKTVEGLKEARFSEFYRKRASVYLKFTSLDPIRFLRQSQDSELVRFCSSNEEFLKKLESVLQHPVEVLERLVAPEEPTAVLCHGDFYRNNVLYRYEDGRPRQVKFVDFQTARYADPVVDVVFFFYLNTTSELRRRHFGDLLETYRETLLDRLVRASGGSSDRWQERVPSLRVLHGNVERHALYGYVVATMFLHLVLASRRELLEMEEMKAGERDEVVPSEEYLRRVVRLGGTEAMARSVAIIRELAEMDQTALFSDKIVRKL